MHHPDTTMMPFKMPPHIKSIRYRMHGTFDSSHGGFNFATRRFYRFGNLFFEQLQLRKELGFGFV
jgi:hypothetical protein